MKTQKDYKTFNLAQITDIYTLKKRLSKIETYTEILTQVMLSGSLSYLRSRELPKVVKSKSTMASRVDVSETFSADQL